MPEVSNRATSPPGPKQTTAGRPTADQLDPPGALRLCREPAAGGTLEWTGGHHLPST